MLKKPPEYGRPRFDPRVGKIPWREWILAPVFCPGEFHELYCPLGHKESDRTERLSLSLSITKGTRERQGDHVTWHSVASEMTRRRALTGHQPPPPIRTWGPSATLWQSEQRTLLPFCRRTDWGAERWQCALSYSLVLAKGIISSTNHLFLLFFILPLVTKPPQITMTSFWYAGNTLYSHLGGGYS